MPARCNARHVAGLRKVPTARSMAVKNAWAALIEKILTHLGLDPQPPPKRRAREAGHDFAA